YTGDYPEKVLLATIHQDGVCCCPRCLVKKDEIRRLGTADDHALRQEYRRFDDAERRRLIQKARKLIYENGVPVFLLLLRLDCVDSGYKMRSPKLWPSLDLIISEST
ncbi:hypothetical protein SISSUDRAFT_995420, partial [Sistotremastrum suecicum HHB10207 ss-3]